jgi:predicted ester cyclase
MFRKSLHAAHRFGAALALSALLAGCATAEPPLAPGEFGRAVHGAEAARHIETFDTLDFDVFSHQRWERLHESHAENIIVTWPDGHDTHGIETHTHDLQQMFVHAPDTKIEIHPIRVATGEWTAVTGVMTGTFTQPLRLADGTVIQPTGRAFSVPMATFGHWTNGRMDHEWLYWDNQTYMRQLGLAE